MIYAEDTLHQAQRAMHRRHRRLQSQDPVATQPVKHVGASAWYGTLGVRNSGSGPLLSELADRSIPFRNVLH